MNDCTLVLIKPDAFERNLVGTVLSQFENLVAEGKCNIIKYDFLNLNKEQVQNFYSHHKGKTFWNELIDFMVSGPVMIAILQARSNYDIIKECRVIVDELRSMWFNLPKHKNLVHSSDSLKSFEKECKIIYGGFNAIS